MIKQRTQKVWMITKVYIKINIGGSNKRFNIKRQGHCYIGTVLYVATERQMWSNVRQKGGYDIKK